MQVNLSDPLHGHSINANLFVDPDCSPTRDANVDEKKLSKQERNRRNVRNFYKRRKVCICSTSAHFVETSYVGLFGTIREEQRIVEERVLANETAVGSFV